MPVPWTRKNPQGQVQTRQVQITLGNGGALDLEIEDGGGFTWKFPLEYPWNQDLISTIVIAVYGYIDV